MEGGFEVGAELKGLLFVKSRWDWLAGWCLATAEICSPMRLKVSWALKRLASYGSSWGKSRNYKLDINAGRREYTCSNRSYARNPEPPPLAERSIMSFFFPAALLLARNC